LIISICSFKKSILKGENHEFSGIAINLSHSLKKEVLIVLPFLMSKKDDGTHDAFLGWF